MEIYEKIEAARIVAIVRGNYVGAFRAIAEALITGGIGVMEITLNSAGALDAIQMVAAEFGDKILIGAGTVLEAREVAQVAQAGAQFVISPALLPEVIKASADHGIEAIPGTFTATEIIAAHRWGARLIKVFPIPSPDYLRAIRGPLADLHLMPTGGIVEANVRAYLDAGAAAIGLGTSLVSGSFDGSPQAAADLTERARRIMAIAKG